MCTHGHTEGARTGDGFVFAHTEKRQKDMTEEVLVAEPGGAAAGITRCPHAKEGSWMLSYNITIHANSLERVTDLNVRGKTVKL